MMAPRNSHSTSGDPRIRRPGPHFRLCRWAIGVAALVVAGSAILGAAILAREGTERNRDPDRAQSAAIAAESAIGDGLFSQAAAHCRLTPASGRPPPVQHQSLLLGVSAALDLFHGSGRCEQARLAAATGVQAVREDISWARTEPRPNRYNWANYDSVVRTATEAGLVVLPLITSAPAWAAPTWNSLPSNPAAYAAFVAATVRRYGPSGTFWRANPQLRRHPLVWYELWNEPYDAAHNRDPGVYARLVRAAVTAGRAANPAARFLIDATTVTVHGDPDNWIGGMYAAVPDLGRYLDGLAVHPYGGDPTSVTPGRKSYDEPAAQVEQAHADLVAQGDGNKPLWITEIGWSTCFETAGCVSEAEQASYLRTILRLARTTWRPYVRAVFVYALRDLAPAPSDEGEAWFGLIRPNLSHKPAWHVLYDAARGSA